MNAKRLWPLGAVAVGLVVAVIVAIQVGVTLHDTVVLVGVSGGAAIGAGTVGWAGVRAIRSRSLQVQVLVVGSVAVVATGIGVIVAAEAMFISAHDLGALGVVLVTAASVGIGAAIACTNTVADAAEALRGLARNITNANQRGAETPDVPAGALAKLADELAESERRLTESRRREQALEASRRELVAWMSHDLRSPLATVQAIAEALEDEVVDDRVTIARYHQVMRSETQRLSRLVDGLFELSRIASGTVAPDPHRVALGELVDDAAAAAGHSTECGVGVVVASLDSDVAAELVPARDVARVLANLLDNGVRHTPLGGTVTVRLDRRGSAAVIEVDDQCGGIPPDDLPRVFDTAFRGDAARRRDASGGGLGLAVTKGLVELLGGTIHAANADAGCRFVVWLPIEAHERVDQASRVHHPLSR